MNQRGTACPTIFLQLTDVSSSQNLDKAIRSGQLLTRAATFIITTVNKYESANLSQLSRLNWYQPQSSSLYVIYDLPKVPDGASGAVSQDVFISNPTLNRSSCSAIYPLALPIIGMSQLPK